MASIESSPLALSSNLGWVGRLDAAIYRLEVIIVVTALLLMSIMVFVDVAFQISTSFRIGLNQGATSTYVGILFTCGFIGLMAFAATGHRFRSRPHGESAETEELPEERPLGFRLGITAAVLALTVGFGWAMINLESSTIYRILTLAIMGAVLWDFFKNGEQRKFVIALISTILALYLCGTLPSGHSWAPGYGLTMLLWVGFLGASMAAQQRRHLRVDLMRKLLSPAKLPLFNAISYLVSAIFTLAVFYLAVEYMMGDRSAYLNPVFDAPAWLPEATREALQTRPTSDTSYAMRFLYVVFGYSEPGTIPGWVKVISIPIATGLIFLRFLGHTIVFGRMALRKEEYVEVLGLH